MSRRKKTTDEPVVARQLLEQAKRSVSTDGPRPSQKKRRCKVCGAECAPFSVEDLCWVCRRLKISAWRDADLQMSLQD